MKILWQVSFRPLNQSKSNDSVQGAFLDNIKKLDGLINCAGIVPKGNIMECNENEWQHSINTNLTWSGLALYKIDIMIVFIHTDFPAPVAPAISKWGNCPKSNVNASPVVVLPIAILNLDKIQNLLKKLLMWIKL